MGEVQDAGILQRGDLSLTPEKKAQQRLNRHMGRMERRKAAEFAEFIRKEAMDRSQIIGRSDQTVWEAYENLRMEARR